VPPPTPTLTSARLTSLLPMLCRSHFDERRLACATQNGIFPPDFLIDTDDRAVIKTALSVETVMNNPNWEVEHERFMADAYPRTMTAAKRAFYGWHSRKKEDAEAELVGKVWHSYRALLKRGKNPEPMISGLIKYAILWVKYDRRIAGRSRNIDIYDYRSRFSQHLMSEQGDASASERSSAANSWINFDQHTGDDPALLAAALETSGVTLNQWCDC
jgi:hypothetical protein